MRGEVPEDRCPFPRPFDWDFDECPAFLPQLHFATDLHGRALKAVWTCAHLGTKRRDSGAYYPVCLLGEAADRRRWAAALKVGQLSAIRHARVSLSRRIRPQVETLRAALSSPADPFDARRRGRVREGWADLATAFDAFVVEQPEIFIEAGIDPYLLRDCFFKSIDEFGRRDDRRDWQMAESIVQGYPWPIIAFFRPDLIRERALGEARVFD